MEDVEDFFISMGWQISSGRKSKPNGTTSTPEFRPGPSGPPDAGHLLRQGQSNGDAAGFVGSNMVVRTQTSLRSGPCPP